MRNRFVVCIFSFIALAGAAAPASAQEPSRFNLAVATGLVDFDLSGTGQTVGTAIRGERALSRHFAIEFGSLFAKPSEAFGRSTLIAPEALLRASWQAGRVAPYLAAGGGTVLRRYAGQSAWNLSTVGAGGVRVRLTDRLSAQAEMRLRGVGRRFQGSTAEWTAGLVWAPSAF